jgi:hypothetical protein
VLNEIRSKISFFTCDFNDVSVGALAADNLSCSGPFGKLPPGKTPISNGSIDVGPHKAGKASGKSGVDSVCINYTNSTAGNQSARLKVEIH